MTTQRKYLDSQEQAIEFANEVANRPFYKKRSWKCIPKKDYKGWYVLISCYGVIIGEVFA